MLTTHAHVHVSIKFLQRKLNFLFVFSVSRASQGLFFGLKRLCKFVTYCSYRFDRGDGLYYHPHASIGQAQNDKNHPV